MKSPRERVRSCYDWAVVFRRYAELWSELRSIRLDAARHSSTAPAPRAFADAMNPFELFSHYPTQLLDGNTLLTRRQSSHDLSFPFLIEEILHLIGIKVVYLTDDHVRKKWKWKRDMDYRKKLIFLTFETGISKINSSWHRWFICLNWKYAICVWIPTGAALWTTPEVAEILDQD